MLPGLMWSVAFQECHPSTLELCSVDRLWSVTWSLHYRNYNSGRKSLYIILGTWCLVALIWLPPFLYDRFVNDYNEGDCYWDTVLNRNLSSEYSFVLVRLFRRSRRATLAGHLALTGSFKSAVGRIRVGSMESVNQFLDQYGTHVITEYEVGDVLYQVYVFGNRTYSDFKNNFAMSQSSENELMRMERYFTPSHALHIGRVKLASGNPEFEVTIRRELLKITVFRIYHSIFMIFKNKELEKRLEQLDGEVILGLKLEKITKIVPKSPERHWLGEILDNVLSLFYVTM